MNLKLVGLFKKEFKFRFILFGYINSALQSNCEQMHLNNCVLRRGGGSLFWLLFQFAKGIGLSVIPILLNFSWGKKRLKKYVLGKQVWVFLCNQVNSIISEKMILFDHCCQKQCRLVASTIVGGLRSTDFWEKCKWTKYVGELNKQNRQA